MKKATPFWFLHTKRVGPLISKYLASVIPSELDIMASKSSSTDWSRLDKVVQFVDWEEQDLTFSRDQRENRLSVAIIGHSYVTHMIKDMKEVYNKIGSTPQDQLALRGTQLYPSLFGMSGGKISDIPILAHVAKSVNPHILIVEIAQNDLCRVNSDPEVIADSLISQIENAVKLMPRIEVIAYCQVIMKTEIRYGKPLDMLNDDLECFNIHMLKKTRGDLKNLRWRHMGMFDPEEPITWDGTHPNTPQGKAKYWASIAELCQVAKQRVILLRTKTKSAIKRQMKKEKRQKREKYWEEKAKKESKQSLGRARRFDHLVGKV
jgi:hypothetical protein